MACGPTETTFTQQNLQQTFGGVLRYLTLPADTAAEAAPSSALYEGRQP